MIYSVIPPSWRSVLTNKVVAINWPRLRVHARFISELRKFGPKAFMGGPAPARSNMKSPMVIALVAVVLVTFSTLAIMNNACKNNPHG